LVAQVGGRGRRRERADGAATVSEAVAKAFENAKDLPEEVSSVTTRDIAGPDMSLRATLASLRACD
jgi:hypothetical protein